MAWTRTDDLDGTPATQRTFGLDGKAYTIDLSDANAAKLLKVLQPYVTVAQVYNELPTPPTDALAIRGTIDSPDVSPADVRRVQDLVKPADPPAGGSGVTPPRGARRRRGKAAVPRETIRQWANENGFQVAPMGRIPDRVMVAFGTAHP
jgi:hypothetical protein